jgi:hypothetical protein
MLVLRIIEDAMIKRGFTGEAEHDPGKQSSRQSFLHAIGAEKYKTYRIYRRPLATL